MARNKVVDELIKKNPVNKGLDYGFVDDVMRAAAVRHFPGIASVDSVRHVRHKRRVGKRNSTFIYSYYITGTTRDRKKIKKQMVYSSHSDGSRLRADQMLAKLIKAGFNDTADTNRVMVPLEYLPEIQTLIYEAVPGKTLYQHMQECSKISDLSDIIRATAAWIRKFHEFKLSQDALSKLPPFDPFNLNWKADELLTSVLQADKHQAEKLSAFLSTFRSEEGRVSGALVPRLVYGDLHPENVITTTLHPKGLTMIDFTDVTRGDQMRDIGTFIQQLHFMGTQFFAESQVDKIRIRFLEDYFEIPFKDIPATTLARINLYQAWNSLRGFVYFFFQEKNRIRSYGLLEDAWRFLNLTQEKKHYITITYRV